MKLKKIKVIIKLLNHVSKRSHLTKKDKEFTSHLEETKNELKFKSHIQLNSIFKQLMSIGEKARIAYLDDYDQELSRSTSDMTL